MRRIILTIFILTFVLTKANAQFSGAQSTSENNVPSQPKFTLKQYFNALGHKEDTLNIGQMLMGSLILPGTAQVYNKDYWKLPIIYAGIGGMAYGAFHYNSQHQISEDLDHLRNRNLFIAGAALVYWASILDGVFSYKSGTKSLPARAALYSALLPGLGQVYNGDWWKIPIFYAGLATAIYNWQYNGSQYLRHKELYLQASDPNGGYTGRQSAEDLKYQRDHFRRFRDYSILATVAFYVLQIVDADVFATMSDFDISDDLSLNIEPAIIQPIVPLNNYNYASVANSSLGIQLKFNF